MVHQQDVKQPLRFPGQIEDGETGFYYNYHRYYNPVVRRYTQPDPIGFAGGFNPYVYADNNPIMKVDPSGLEMTLITTYDFGIGSHSALHIKNSTETFLYDPAGSYKMQKRGSGDFFSGKDAKLQDYIKYQKSLGSSVSLQVLNSSSKAETKIINNAINQGGQMPFMCAAGISSAISGYCGIKGSVFPSSLESNIKEIIEGFNKKGIKNCE